MSNVPSAQVIYDVLMLFIPFFAGSLTTLLGVFVRNRMEVQQQKKDEIYRPLFNEFSDVSTGVFPYDVSEGEYRSAWEGFDNYQRWSVDSVNQRKVESYVAKLELLNRYAATLESVIVDSVDSSDLLVNEELHHDKPNVGVLMSGPYGDRPRGVMQVGDWVQRFAHPMIVSEGVDDLQKKLMEWSLEQGGGHQLNYREWSRPQYEVLYSFVEETDGRIEFPDGISDRHELMKQIQRDGKHLARRMKRKLDGWF